MRAEVYFVSADVDNSRCPRCAALVRPGSQWCTLCYADLRPAPAPALVVQPVAEQAPYLEHAAHADPAGGGFDPLTAPLALLEREPGRVAEVVAVTGPAQGGDVRPAGKHAAPAAESNLRWPCATCGAMVPFDETSCPACGAGFLENVDADTSLHRFGLRGGQISKQTKAVIMIGGSFSLLVLLLGLMYLLGTLL